MTHPKFEDIVDELEDFIYLDKDKITYDST